MRSHNLWRIGLTSFLVTVAIFAQQAVLGGQTAGSHDAAAPTISVSDVPHAGKGGPDETEPISGSVKDVDFAKNKVVIYAFAGGTWWVQPTVASPMTDIDGQGNWQTITHLGSTYAALLVTQSYKPAATTNDVPHVGGDVLAVKLAAGKR